MIITRSNSPNCNQLQAPSCYSKWNCQITFQVFFGEQQEALGARCQIWNYLICEIKISITIPAEMQSPLQLTSRWLMECRSERRKSVRHNTIFDTVFDAVFEPSKSTLIECKSLSVRWKGQMNCIVCTA